MPLEPGCASPLQHMRLEDIIVLNNRGPGKTYRAGNCVDFRDGKTRDQIRMTSHGVETHMCEKPEEPNGDIVLLHNAVAVMHCLSQHPRIKSKMGHILPIFMREDTVLHEMHNAPLFSFLKKSVNVVVDCHSTKLQQDDKEMRNYLTFLSRLKTEGAKTVLHDPTLIFGIQDRRNFDLLLDAVKLPKLHVDVPFSIANKNVDACADDDFNVSSACEIFQEARHQNLGDCQRSSHPLSSACGSVHTCEQDQSTCSPR